MESTRLSSSHPEVFTAKDIKNHVHYAVRTSSGHCLEFNGEARADFTVFKGYTSRRSKQRNSLGEMSARQQRAAGNGSVNSSFRPLFIFASEQQHWDRRICSAQSSRGVDSESSFWD